MRSAARDGAGGVLRGASGNASSVGPHEKPMKKDSGSSRRIELEVVRSAGDPLLPSSSDGWKKAENANGADAVEDTS